MSGWAGPGGSRHAKKRGRHWPVHPPPLLLQAQLRKWIKNIESLESLAQLEARQFKIRREFMAPPVDGMGIGVGMPSCDSMGASQLAAQAKREPSWTHLGLRTPLSASRVVPKAPQQLHFQQPVQQLPPQALQGPQGQPHYVQPHAVPHSASSSEAPACECACSQPPPPSHRGACPRSRRRRRRTHCSFHRSRSLRRSTYTPNRQCARRRRTGRKQNRTRWLGRPGFCQRASRSQLQGGTEMCSEIC